MGLVPQESVAEAEAEAAIAVFNKAYKVQPLHQNQSYIPTTG